MLDALDVFKDFDHPAQIVLFHAINGIIFAANNNDRVPEETTRTVLNDVVQNGRQIMPEDKFMDVIDVCEAIIPNFVVVDREKKQ